MEEPLPPIPPRVQGPRMSTLYHQAFPLVTPSPSLSFLDDQVGDLEESSQPIPPRAQDPGLSVLYHQGGLPGPVDEQSGQEDGRDDDDEDNQEESPPPIPPRAHGPRLSALYYQALDLNIAAGPRSSSRNSGASSYQSLDQDVASHSRSYAVHVQAVSRALDDNVDSRLQSSAAYSDSSSVYSQSSESQGPFQYDESPRTIHQVGTHNFPPTPTSSQAEAYYTRPIHLYPVASHFENHSVDVDVHTALQSHTSSQAEASYANPTHASIGTPFEREDLLPHPRRYLSLRNPPSMHSQGLIQSRASSDSQAPAPPTGSRASTDSNEFWTTPPHPEDEAYNRAFASRLAAHSILRCGSELVPQPLRPRRPTPIQVAAPIHNPSISRPAPTLTRAQGSLQTYMASQMQSSPSVVSAPFRPSAIMKCLRTQQSFDSIDSTETVTPSTTPARGFFPYSHETQLRSAEDSSTSTSNSDNDSTPTPSVSQTPTTKQFTAFYMNLPQPTLHSDPLNESGANQEICMMEERSRLQNFVPTLENSPPGDLLASSFSKDSALTSNRTSVFVPIPTLTITPTSDVEEDSDDDIVDFNTVPLRFHGPNGYSIVREPLLLQTGPSSTLRPPVAPKRIRRRRQIPDVAQSPIQEPKGKGKEGVHGKLQEHASSAQHGNGKRKEVVCVPLGDHTSSQAQVATPNSLVPAVQASGKQSAAQTSSQALNGLRRRIASEPRGKDASSVPRQQRLRITSEPIDKHVSFSATVASSSAAKGRRSRMTCDPVESDAFSSTSASLADPKITNSRDGPKEPAAEASSKELKRSVPVSEMSVSRQPSSAPPQVEYSHTAKWFRPRSPHVLDQSQIPQIAFPTRRKLRRTQIVPQRHIALLVARILGSQRASAQLATETPTEPLAAQDYLQSPSGFQASNGQKVPSSPFSSQEHGVRAGTEILPVSQIRSSMKTAPAEPITEAQIPRAKAVRASQVSFDSEALCKVYHEKGAQANNVALLSRASSQIARARSMHNPGKKYTTGTTSSTLARARSLLSGKKSFESSTASSQIARGESLPGNKKPSDIPAVASQIVRARSLHDNRKSPHSRVASAPIVRAQVILENRQPALAQSSAQTLASARFTLIADSDDCKIPTPRK